MDGKKFVIMLFLSFIYTFPAKGNEYSIHSPNGKILAYFHVSGDKNACYRIDFSGESVLGESKLGIVREDEDFFNGLSLESVSGIETVNSYYRMPQGKKRRCSYIANKRTFHLKNANGEKMDII